MRDFVENTVPYLEQYHQRINSESGFAADKKCLGGMLHREGMIALIMHYYAPACGTAFSIWAGLRIVSHTPKFMEQIFRLKLNSI